MSRRAVPQDDARRASAGVETTPMRIAPEPKPKSTLADSARFYLRALNYYRKDWPLVSALLCVICASTLLGLLMA